MKHNSSPFKWHHHPPELILLCVRWYCRYQLSYRDVEEMMRERGFDMPEAFSISQEERVVPKDCQLRRVKCLNNVIEQGHRFIKKVRASQCFKSFRSAERTLEVLEAMNMMRKGQVKRLSGRDVGGQAKFVASLFRSAA